MFLHYFAVCLLTCILYNCARIGTPKFNHHNISNGEAFALCCDGRYLIKHVEKKKKE